MTPPMADEITLRRWYAGMVLQGFCSLQFRADHPELTDPTYWANASFRMADALLKFEENEGKA